MPYTRRSHDELAKDTAEDFKINDIKKPERSFRRLPSGKNDDADAQHAVITTTVLNGILIIHFHVELNLLILHGKGYPWPRPDVCPHCGGNHLWGHGYTPRYFNGYPRLIWLKRYYCVACKRVHTLRPKTHWRRFQTAISTIIESLRSKIEHDCWLSEFPHQRQQYWMQGLITQAKVIHPADGRNAYQRLKDLLARNVIVATQSLKWRQITIGKTFNFVPAV